MKQWTRSGRTHLVLATVLLSSVAATVPALAVPSGGAPDVPGSAQARGSDEPVPGPARGEDALAGRVDPGIIELMKKQEALDKAVDLITDGREEFERDRIPGFSEVEVDPAAGRIVLHWKGELPEPVAAVIRGLPEAVKVEVVPAKYSKAELHAARTKLLSDGMPRALPASRPSHINSIGPSSDGSGLDLGYEPDDAHPRNIRSAPAQLPGDELTPQIESLASALAGVEVHAHRQAQVIDLTRGDDGSPWRGGAGVETPGGTICSTGFGVYGANSRDLVTTAWHCGEGNYKTWYSKKPMGNASKKDGNAADDTIGIAPHTGKSGAYVYDGPWNESTGYAKPVAGYGANNVGDFVCQSAANSGVHCGLRIQEVDRQIVGPNKVMRKLADKVVQTDPHDIAAANGDSGGPVFALTDGGKKDLARGTVTSLESETNCAGRKLSDGGSRSPWCFKAMWYVPISQTLADMGWTLRKS
ncbi:trypsin-like serine protease [Kitasatospora sp. NPDC094011]|uniref:trypsin-like serine protease n=1 Tax=Kitasatospora sp. NPDC094011 TaxID=3364090 RepID=UPI00382CDE58